MSRVGVISAIALLTLVVAVSVTTSKAHAQVVLDSTTTTMLVSVISATGNLVTTVQADINANAFTPSQSVALSGTLGGISTVLANISTIIGGATFPSTGFAPYPGSTN